MKYIEDRLCKYNIKQGLYTNIINNETTVTTICN